MGKDLCLRTVLQGIPWQSSGWDSALPLLRAWVQFLVRELRSHKPQVKDKKQTNKQKNCIKRIYFNEWFYNLLALIIVAKYWKQHEYLTVEECLAK